MAKKPTPQKPNALPRSEAGVRFNIETPQIKRGVVSYKSDFDEIKDELAQEIQSSSERRLSLKEALEIMRYDPQHYPHDGPPKRPGIKLTVREKNHEYSLDKIHAKNSLKSVSSISVSLDSVMTVLSNVFQNDSALVSMICERIEKVEEIARQAKIPLSIPTIAPERWADRGDKSQNPGQFIQRVYGQWIGQGFHTGHVRKLDAALMKAYEIWLERGALDAPAAFHLPTYSETMVQKERLSPELMRRAVAQLRRDQRDRDR